LFLVGSPGSQNGISLHDELLLTNPNLGHRYQNQHSTPNNFERSNGVKVKG